ncbi:hypothetical protein GCM10007978_49940 [Shewanella hanedai]|uniref:Uncharacterized protein n=1 Tax=Shewanella hanedai TaxID=25 RepID=A0A553JKT2_SHEHA|nr:hypothetical protein [Shewanella hanedai]TRY13062.1 hypothetical protein FN961_17495 [Shewanella hanedai]GGJ06451.1 hypothetical protein GCM10007978_49940 [Shewanella hanedai]
MKKEQDFTEAELIEMAEILERYQGQMLKEIESVIGKHVQAASSELVSTDPELANYDYFSAVVLGELFSKLHGGDKDTAGIIIYNLQGQADLNN